MIITYNGTTLAREWIDGGTDGVRGFTIAGEATSQWLGGLDVINAIPVPRQNRKRTIAFTIRPLPSTVPGLAMANLLNLLGTLAPSGVLTVQEGLSLVTFASAQIEALRTQEREGVAYAAQLTFLAGLPVLTQIEYLTTEDGSALTTEDGNRLIL